EDKTANHAETSKMPFDGRTGVNDFSIGIELAYYPDKTDSQGKARDGEPNRFQYDALKRLIPEIKSRQQIKYIVLHCQIAGKDVRGGGTGNEIKKDPERFEWSKIESVLQGGIQHLKTNCEGQTS
ncbi:MAG: N-acetylmuramoyl-L-alanine amidase, partial [bacterium]